MRDRALREIIRLYPEAPETFSMFKKYFLSNGTGARGLVKYYLDRPETLPLLKELAQFGENVAAQWEAIKAIGEHYREDPETLPMLKELNKRGMSAI